MTLSEGDVRAPGSGLLAVGLLAVLAACGRIGYEPGVAVLDGPVAAPDGADVGGQVDNQAHATDLGVVGPADPRPDAAAPDTASADAPGAEAPADAFAPPDVAPPADAPAPDAGVDAAMEQLIVATGQTLTPRRGGGSSAVQVDICPDDGLVVGIEGTQSTNAAAPVIQSVAAVCATIRPPLAGAPVGYGYVKILPARGNTSGQRWMRMCPEGHVLVGFDGNAGAAIGQIVFACAPVRLDASGRSVVLGSDIELDDVGVPAATDFPQTDCPTNQGARGIETRTGTRLEAFALVCASLILR